VESKVPVLRGRINLLSDQYNARQGIGKGRKGRIFRPYRVLALDPGLRRGDAGSGIGVEPTIQVTGLSKGSE
jgi:hypothetical protein